MSPVDLDNTTSADTTTVPQQSEAQNDSDTTQKESPSGAEDYKEKYAAAQKEISEWRGRAEKRAEEVNRYKRALLGEDEPQKESEPELANKSDLEALKNDIRWELKNESQISIADQNGKYSEYISQGLSKDVALKLALFDEGITNNADSSLRQAKVAAPPAGLDRTDSVSPIDGLPKDYVQKLRDQGLDDAKIRAIAKNAMERAAKRK